MSFKYVLAIVVGILLAQIVAVGQLEMPSNWQRFSSNRPGFSILMPRLPVLARSSNVCDGVEKVEHAVYFEEVIYELEVIYAAKGPIPKSCGSDTRNPKQVLFQMMAEFRKSAPDVESKLGRTDGSKILKSSEGLTKSWIVDSTSDGAIYVMKITSRDGSPTDESVFVDSLRIGGDVKGIEIGDGAKSNSSDNEKDFGPKPSNSSGGTDGDSSALVIRFQPRALYTMDARNARTEGAVRLKITLLSNGGVGAVTPVTFVPNGLTEEAIAAAKKIVFIPKRVNGVNVSVIVTREYTFSIY